MTIGESSFKIYILTRADLWPVITFSCSNVDLLFWKQHKNFLTSRDLVNFITIIDIRRCLLTFRWSPNTILNLYSVFVCCCDETAVWISKHILFIFFSSQWLFIVPTCRYHWCSAASCLCWARIARGHAGAELCTCVTRRSTPRVTLSLRDTHTLSLSLLLISFLSACLCSSRALPSLAHRR